MKTKILIPLIAGLGLLCACKGKNSAHGADSTMTEATRKSAVQEKNTGDTTKKLVKTADLELKVRDVQQAYNNIEKLTRSFKGSIIHHYIHTVVKDSSFIQKTDDSLLKVTVLNTTAEIVAKIAPNEMENFLTEVAQLGLYTKNSKLDIEDKSFDYLATKLKLQNQNELINNQKHQSANTKDPDNLLAFKNRMVDQRIGNEKIADSSKNSIVTLNLSENNIVTKEIVANDNLSDYNGSFSKRLSSSLGNGWSAFVASLIFIANFWVLVPVAIGAWLIIRRFKNKKPAVTN
jgi:hypothetical protein